MAERELFVAGHPAAQGSKRHVGGGHMVEMSKRLKPWRAAIAEAIITAGWHHDPILSGPVRVQLDFVMPRPASHYGTGRNADRLKDTAPDWCDRAVGDLDKLCRAVLDAVTTAGAWRDDAQVVSLSATKRYGRAGVTIAIEDWS